MMNGGSSVIVTVNSDTASCNENLQRSKRSGSMVGSRIIGTMSIAMRRSIAESAGLKWGHSSFFCNKARQTASFLSGCFVIKK